MQCDLTFNLAKFENLPIFIKRTLFVRFMMLVLLLNSLLKFRSKNCAGNLGRVSLSYKKYCLYCLLKALVSTIMLCTVISFILPFSCHEDGDNIGQRSDDIRRAPLLKKTIHI